jgi:hypothetical protein
MQYKSIGNAAVSEGQFFFLTNPVAADMTGAIPRELTKAANNNKAVSQFPLHQS